MYKTPKYRESSMKSIKTVEGETIEQKIERIVDNKEAIKDGAPEIFTARVEGVLAGYNIRTDRWDLATDAMDYVSRQKMATRESRGKIDIEKNAIIESGNSETESVQGEKGVN